MHNSMDSWTPTPEPQKKTVVVDLRGVDTLTVLLPQGGMQDFSGQKLRQLIASMYDLAAGANAMPSARRDWSRITATPND